MTVISQPSLHKQITDQYSDSHVFFFVESDKGTYLSQHMEPLLAPPRGAKYCAEKPREKNFCFESLHLPIILPNSFLEALHEKSRSFWEMKGGMVLKEYSQSRHYRSHEQE